ncbi:MAG TPA: hypothetical protein DDX89_08000 [Candidatus Omnitrophica bacterium]|nr:MAG: hypothetical protein A2Z92_05240 [Omnitrophica WOR_2 bacterium GWA2_63_20]OGX15293.1 MAG: hypothetical protein A2105_04245 [Omnitrophica WOR_2 bacterium GWF2_63_9]OGX33271.1 MAG: hypothetical protein A3E56_01585 [Omnitrophica WOR_2 bacterium RIFCSPHIGHO2_12_FULL_64_13]OGX36191.1 MAG: hypothetical protein A3B73_01740 [Omnitrophica WOR_2 bacterium RIFCSPHIGHO2_02_FULL_63_39]OGX45600.1 MAG: hypothetical protein A3I71_01975 [Omnitrophica WOR_2 bacterium RIFCSPLOWO2_02_FULL_63_16]OGX48482.1
MESLHPLLVHFPIALLLTAAGLDLLALLLKRPSLHCLALWNLALGTVGAGAAVLSGLQAEDVAKHSFEIWQVMELHQRLGFSTLALGAISVSWRIAKQDRLTPRARLVTMLLETALVGTLSWGAYLGGRLVYELGVGGTFGAIR